MLLWGDVSVLARWETGGVYWAVLWEQPLFRSLQGSHRELWSWGGPEGGGWILGEVAPVSQPQGLGRNSAVSLPQPTLLASGGVSTSVPEQEPEQTHSILCNSLSVWSPLHGLFRRSHPGDKSLFT